MYHTKKDVDAHVRSVLKKLQSERDRQLRGLTIAKMYLRVNELGLAEQYALSYLNANEDNDQAYKLLGQCYLRLKQSEKALQYYQRSLNLNSKQPDVITEVCKLLSDDKIFNPNKALYWCELAESEKVFDESVFNLRLKLMHTDSIASDKFEEMLQKQISAKPTNITMRVRLLQYYVDQKKILDAFKYVLNYETKQHYEFCYDADWYNVVAIVLAKYEALANIKKDFDFWLLQIMCLERQIQLSFSTCSVNFAGGKEITNLLFTFDQYLYQLSQVVGKLSCQRELSDYFLNHYRGQLLLHIVTLIFNREIAQNKNRWKETTIITLPLLLMAYQLGKINKEPWMLHCDEQGKTLVQLWKREAAFRCCQAARTILSCIDESIETEDVSNITNKYLGNKCLWSNSNDLLNQVRSTCNDKSWRRKVFLLLFTNTEQKVKEQTSFLIKCSKLSEPIYELPVFLDLERFEENAFLFRPQSLSYMVYLCLGSENLASVRAKCFSGLSFSVANLSTCAAESLNQLDIDSFMYAASIQAERSLEVEKESHENYYSTEGEIKAKPRMLLFNNILNHLCTDDQANWWTAAYNTYKNIPSENTMETRQNLQYGIEAVRGVNGPKIDTLIMFKLGKIFVERSQDVVKPIEKTQLEARAENIYKCGLNMIKLNNKGILEPFRKLFKYSKSNSTAVERQISAAAEEATSYLAARFFKKGEYEDFIEELNGVQLPFASYLQAEAYRKLDEISKTPKASRRLYIEKASECLTQTLEYLKNPQVDPNHPLNSIIHGEIRKTQISGILNNSTTEYFSSLNGSGGGHSTLHNNSSSYEDAEEGIFGDSLRTPNVTLNRSRRDSNIAAVLQSALLKNSEMENVIKQISNTVTSIKDDMFDKVNTHLCSIAKDVGQIKEKVCELDEFVKKSNRASSRSPSRDDVSNALDLYAIDDALQNHLYAQATNIYPNMGSNIPTGMGLINSTFGNQQQMPQSKTLSQSALQMQSPYGNLFNQNYPITYPPPFLMPNSGAAPGQGSTGVLNQAQLGHSALGQASLGGGGGASLSLPQQSLLGAPRNNIGMPFVDGSNNFNFNLPPQFQLPPNHDNRGFNFLNQPLASASNNGLFNVPVPSLNLKDNINFPPPLSLQTTTSSSFGSSITITTLGSNSNINTPAASVSFNKVLNNQPVEKGPPANVVITNSDPLPNPNMIAQQQTQQPTLSVTIPSHHIKPSLVSQNNDITTTTSGSPQISSSNVVGSFSSQTVATSSSLPLFGKPITNAPGFFTNSSAKDTINDTINAVVKDTDGKSLNKSDLDQISKCVEEEYDARPDFQPIIPLPDEVKVRTGEEDQVVVFTKHAKLYRWAESGWKERGVGDIKILKDKGGLSRIVMRRDQTHKICANHNIVKGLTIVVPKKDNRSLIWTAQDFADEEVKSEKFYVQFKDQESAKQFLEAFKKALKEYDDWEAKNSDKNVEATSIPVTISSKDLIKITETPKDEKQSNAFSLDKNIAPIFTSTPANKNDSINVSLRNTTVADTTPTTISNINATITSDSKSLFSNLAPKSTLEQTKTSTNAVSPFQGFSFSTTTSTAPGVESTNIFANIGKSSPANNKNSLFSLSNISNAFQMPQLSASSVVQDVTLNKSTNEEPEDDYIPTAEFHPVIPLPDLVEITTGEENEIVLFEHRAKLLRFDKTASEWKERGLGNIKLLQDKNDVNKVRLVMRREQIHKLCCNQRLYKNTQFKYAKNSETALSWAGPDYSENELVTQMLTIRFKTSEICKRFLEAIVKAQEKMSDESTEQSDGKISITEVTDSSSNANIKAQGFGDKFKPKAGSWNCNACYISNDGANQYCVACDTPKDDTVPKKDQKDLFAPSGKSTFNFGFVPTSFPLAESKLNEPSKTTQSNVPSAVESKPAAGVTFGIPTVPTVAALTTTKGKPSNKDPLPAIKGFGDQFKPKVGSWDCKTCYLSNPGDVAYCNACKEPKDGNAPQKETGENNILTLSNPNQQFSFGFNASIAPVTITPTSFMPKSLEQNTVDSSSTFPLPSTTKPEVTKSSSNIFENLATTNVSKSFSFTAPTVVSSTVASATTNASTNALNTQNSIQKEKFTFTLHSKAMEKPADGTFNFTMKPKSPAKGGNKVGNEEDENDDSHEEEEEQENNTYFAPVIPLPDKIEVKTGEECEELLYVHRAKLFRYVDSNWKERGIGDVKILRHKETKKLRVVMRREQVLKICLNHILNDSVEYIQKDEKSWLFVANDFSEGVVELEKFVLRFRNKEIADNFMAAVKEALEGKAKAIEDTSVKQTETTSSKSNTSLQSMKSSESSETLKCSESTETKINEKQPEIIEEKQGDDIKYVEVTTEVVETEYAPKQQLADDITSSSTGKAASKSGEDVEPAVKSEENPLPLAMPKLKPVKPKQNIVLKKSSLANVSLLNTSENKATDSPATGSISVSISSPNISKDKDNISVFGGGSSATEKPNNGSNFSFATALHSTASAERGIEDGGSLMSANFDDNKFGSSSLFGSFSGKSIFGGGVGGVETTKTSTAGSIFSLDGKTNNIFGSPSVTESANSINTQIENKSTTNSIFGSGTTYFGGGASIFGSPQTFLDSSGKDPTMNNPITSGVSIFGSSSTFGSKPIFGDLSKPAFGDLSKPAFGESSFGTLTSTDKIGSSTNNNSGAPKSIFGDAFKPAFGENSFGTLTSDKITSTNNSSGTPKSIFGSTGISENTVTFAELTNKTETVDFASLASKAEKPTDLSSIKMKGGKQGFDTTAFIGLTEQQDAFTVKKDSASNDNSLKNSGDVGCDDGNPENYDPHYEPIISLPDEIALSTGEEEETKLFGERAVLYRFDSTNKEWKERGTGEIKVLAHPERHTYRLVMRREQIHKLVLNHAVGADFSFDSFNNNPKSFIWAAINFAESKEGDIEKLAVRFKKVETANEFCRILDQCIAEAKKLNK